MTRWLMRCLNCQETWLSDADRLNFTEIENKLNSGMIEGNTYPAENFSFKMINNRFNTPSMMECQKCRKK